MDIQSLANNVGMSAKKMESSSNVGGEEAATKQVQASTTELLHKNKQQLSIAEEAIVKAIEKANKALAGVEKSFQYSVHEKTGDIIVKVINQDTKEVIREIPPEKLIDLVVKLQEISGVIIDEKR
ncbi:flagellar protein FlaG [Paenibacillus sp. NPDC056579]|uniref:flagellar protein FlaG n=1 Tax=Paenibacillus sp. NPDC056579 TaxID=3345871 RepID=UPI0036AF4B01